MKGNILLEMPLDKHFYALPQAMTTKKRILVSTSIVIFFSFCLFQPLAGNREDWPFSFFGMYMGRLSYNHTSRFDIDVVFPDGKKESIFGYGLNFYYLSDVLEQSIRSADDVHNEELKLKLKKFLQSDIVPVMKKHKQLHGAQELQIRYRFWKTFALDAKDRPNDDVIFIRVPVSQ